MTTQKGLAGYRTGRVMQPREILASHVGVRYGRGIVDETFAYDGSNGNFPRELRPGIPMAQITATGLWAPCKRTLVNGSATSVSLVVDSAAFFQVGDTITVGGDTAVAVTAIDYDTETLTIASTTFVDGEEVFCDVAGQVGIEICRGFLGEFINLLNSEAPYAAANRESARLLQAGFVNDAMILGDLAAIRAETEGSGKFLKGVDFADEAGQSVESVT